MLPMLATERFRQTDEMLSRIGVSEIAMLILREARSHGPVETPSHRGHGGRIVERRTVKSGERQIRVLEGSVDDIACLQYENDRSVREFHHLPMFAPLWARDTSTGVYLLHEHLYRFIVIYDGKQPALEDWYTMCGLSELRYASELSNNRYYEDPLSSSQWRDRYAEGFAHARGLRYALRLEDDLPRRLLDNFAFLHQYRRSTANLLTEWGRRKLLRKLYGGSRPLKELLADGRFTAGKIFRAIAEGIVYVNLTEELLSEAGDLVIHGDLAGFEEYRSGRVPENRIRVGDTVGYQGEKWTVYHMTDEIVRIERAGVKKTLSSRVLLILTKCGHHQ